MLLSIKVAASQLQTGAATENNIDNQPALATVSLPGDGTIAATRALPALPITAIRNHHRAKDTSVTTHHNPFDATNLIGGADTNTTADGSQSLPVLSGPNGLRNDAVLPARMIGRHYGGGGSQLPPSYCPPLARQFSPLLVQQIRKELAPEMNEVLPKVDCWRDPNAAVSVAHPSQQSEAPIVQTASAVTVSFQDHDEQAPKRKPLSEGLKKSRALRAFLRERRGYRPGSRRPSQQQQGGLPTFSLQITRKSDGDPSSGSVSPFSSPNLHPTQLSAHGNNSATGMLHTYTPHLAPPSPSSLKPSSRSASARGPNTRSGDPTIITPFGDHHTTATSAHGVGKRLSFAVDDSAGSNAHVDFIAANAPARGLPSIAKNSGQIPALHVQFEDDAAPFLVLENCVHPLDNANYLRAQIVAKMKTMAGGDMLSRIPFEFSNHECTAVKLLASLQHVYETYYEESDYITTIHGDAKEIKALTRLHRLQARMLEGHASRLRNTIERNMSVDSLLPTFTMPKAVKTLGPPPQAYFRPYVPMPPPLATPYLRMHLETVRAVTKPLCAPLVAELTRQATELAEVRLNRGSMASTSKVGSRSNSLAPSVSISVGGNTLTASSTNPLLMPSTSNSVIASIGIKVRATPPPVDCGIVPVKPSFKLAALEVLRRIRWAKAMNLHNAAIACLNQRSHMDHPLIRQLFKPSKMRLPIVKITRPRSVGEDAIIESKAYSVSDQVTSITTLGSEQRDRQLPKISAATASLEALLGISGKEKKKDKGNVKFDPTKKSSTSENDGSVLLMGQKGMTIKQRAVNLERLAQDLADKDVPLVWRDENGMSLLHYAVLREDKELVALLCKHNIEVCYASNDGRTAAHMLLARKIPVLKKLELANALFTNSSAAALRELFDKKNYAGQTIIEFAAIQCDFAVMKTLYIYLEAVKGGPSVRERRAIRQHFSLESAITDCNLELIKWHFDVLKTPLDCLLGGPDIGSGGIPTLSFALQLHPNLAKDRKQVLPAGAETKEERRGSLSGSMPILSSSGSTMESSLRAEPSPATNTTIPKKRLRTLPTSEQYREMLMYLIVRGLPSTMCDRNARNSFHYAARCGAASWISHMLRALKQAATAASMNGDQVDLLSIGKMVMGTDVQHQSMLHALLQWHRGGDEVHTTLEQRQLALENELLPILSHTLVAPNIDPSHSDSYGNTLLHWAVASGSATVLAVVARPIQYDTNEMIHQLCTIRNHDGDTALALAVRSHFAKGIEILMARSITAEVFLSAKGNRDRNVFLLAVDAFAAAEGFGGDHTGIMDERPHCATRKGGNCVDVLLRCAESHGIDVRKYLDALTGPRRETPLHSAIRNRMWHMAALLLTHHASSTAVNADGLSALQLACSDPDDVHFAKLLLSNDRSDIEKGASLLACVTLGGAVAYKTEVLQEYFFSRVAFDLRQTELGHQMLLAAAKTGNLKLLRFALEYGARELTDTTEGSTGVEGEVPKQHNTATTSVLAIFLRTIRLALFDGPTKNALKKKSKLVRYFTTTEGLQECLELATLMVRLRFRISSTVLCDAIACDLPTFAATILSLKQITPDYLEHRDQEKGDMALHMACRRAAHGDGAARWNTIVFTLCERSNKTSVTNSSDESPLTIAIHNNNPLVAVRLILSGHHFSLYLGTLHIVLRPINNDFLESKKSLSVQTMSLMSATWLRARIGWKRSTILADAVCGGRMDIIGLFAQAAHRTSRHTFAELLMAPFDDSWRLNGNEKARNSNKKSGGGGIDAKLDCVLTYAAAKAPALCFEMLLSHCPILDEEQQKEMKEAQDKTQDSSKIAPLQLQFGAVRAALMRAITHGRASNSELLVTLLAQMPPPPLAPSLTANANGTGTLRLHSESIEKSSEADGGYTDSFQVYCEHPTLLHALAATPYKTKRMLKIFLQLLSSDLDCSATAVYNALAAMEAGSIRASSASNSLPPAAQSGAPTSFINTGFTSSSQKDLTQGRIARTTSAVRFLPAAPSEGSSQAKDEGENSHNIPAAEQSGHGNVVSVLKNSQSFIQTPNQQSTTQQQGAAPNTQQTAGLSVMAVSGMSGLPALALGPGSAASGSEKAGVMAASVRSVESPAYVSTYPFEQAPSVLALLLSNPEKWEPPADDDDRDDIIEAVTDVVSFGELIIYDHNRLSPSIDARSLGAPLDGVFSGAPLGRAITDLMLRALLQIEQYDVYEDAVPSSDDSDDEAQDTLLHPTDFFAEKSKNEKNKRGGNLKARRQSAHSIDPDGPEGGVTRNGSARVTRTRFREPSISNTNKASSRAGDMAETEPEESEGGEDVVDQEDSVKNAPTRDGNEHPADATDGGAEFGMFLQPTIVINALSVEEKSLKVPSVPRTPREEATTDDGEAGTKVPNPTSRRASAATAQLADNPHLFASMNATTTHFGLSTTSALVHSSMLNGGGNDGGDDLEMFGTNVANVNNEAAAYAGNLNSSFAAPAPPHICNPFVQCLTMNTLEHIFKHKLLHSINHIVSHLGVFVHLRGHLCQHVFSDGRRFLDVLVGLALPNTVIKKGIDAAREETQSWRASGTWWIETLLDVRHAELIRRIPAPTRSAYPTLSMLRDMSRSDPTTVPSLSDAHYEDTPLHTSIRKGRKRITAHILQSTCAEVDVNAKNAKGRTPLMLAAMLNRTECASQLVSTGVDVMIEDQDGMTALHHAAAAGAASIVELVLADDDGSEAACNASTKPLASYPVLQALRNGKDDCAYALLTSLASERAPKQISIVRTGETLLHFAAMTNCTMSMEVLLASAPSAHLHSITVDGCTCRDYCAVGSSLDYLLRTAGVPRLAPQRNPRPVTMYDISLHAGLVANTLRGISTEGKAFITGCGNYGRDPLQADEVTAAPASIATGATAKSNLKRPGSSPKKAGGKGGSNSNNITATVSSNSAHHNVAQTSSVDAKAYQAATEGKDDLLLSHLKLGATDSVRIRIYNLPHPGVTEKERSALKREVVMALLPFGGVNGTLTYPEGSPFLLPTSSSATAPNSNNTSGALAIRTSSMRRTTSLGGSSEGDRSYSWDNSNDEWASGGGAAGSGSPGSPTGRIANNEALLEDAYGIVILADDSKIDQLLKKDDLLLRKRPLVFVRDTPKGPSYRTSARPGMTGLLHLACRTNCYKSLQYIIESNSVIGVVSKRLLELLSNHYDETGLTPYHCTVLSGSWHCLAVFLKAQIPTRPGKGGVVGPPLTCFTSHTAMYEASLVVPSTLWSVSKGKVTDWVQSSTSPISNLTTDHVATHSHSGNNLNQSQQLLIQQGGMAPPNLPLPNVVTADAEDLTGTRVSLYDDAGALFYAKRAGDRRVTRQIITAGLDKLIESGVEALHWRLVKDLFTDIQFIPDDNSNTDPRLNASHHALANTTTSTIGSALASANNTFNGQPHRASYNYSQQQHAATQQPPPPLELTYESACLRELVKDGIESLIINANADDFDARDSSTEREHFKAAAMFHLAGGVLYRQLHELYDELLHTAASGVYGWLCASKLQEVTFTPMRSEEEARSKPITIRRKLPEAGYQSSMVGAMKASIESSRGVGKKHDSDSDYDIVEENAQNGPRLIKKNKKLTGASDGPADNFGSIHITVPIYVTKHELVCRPLTTAFTDYFSTTAVSIAIDLLHELAAIRKMVGGAVELVLCDRYCAIVHRLVTALARKQYICESVEEASTHADSIAAELQSAISKTNTLTVADINGRLLAALAALRFTHRHIIALAPAAASINPNSSFASFSGITVEDHSSSTAQQPPHPAPHGYFLQLAKGPMVLINPKRTTLKIAFAFSAMKREVFDTNILNSIGAGWEGIGASHRLNVQPQFETAAASVPYKLATLVLGCALEPAGGGASSLAAGDSSPLADPNTQNGSPKTGYYGSGPSSGYGSDKASSAHSDKAAHQQQQQPMHSSLSISHFGAFCGSSWKHRQYGLYQWSLGNSTTLEDAIESLEDPVRVVNEHRGRCARQSHLAAASGANAAGPTLPMFFPPGQQPPSVTANQINLPRRYTAASDAYGNSSTSAPYYRLSAMPTIEPHSQITASAEDHATANNKLVVGFSDGITAPPGYIPVPTYLSAAKKRSSSTSLTAAQSSTTDRNASSTSHPGGGTALPAWVVDLKARIEDLIPNISDKFRDLPPEGWSMEPPLNDFSMTLTGEGGGASTNAESWSASLVPGRDALAGTATFVPSQSVHHNQSRKLSILRGLQRQRSINTSAMQMTSTSSTTTGGARRPSGTLAAPPAISLPPLPLCQRYSPHQWVAFMETLFEMTHDFQLLLYTVARSCKTWRSAVSVCLRSNSFVKILSCWVVETALATDALLQKARLVASRRDQYGWMLVPVGARTAVKSWLCVESMRTLRQKSSKTIRPHGCRRVRNQYYTKQNEPLPAHATNQHPMTTDAAYCEAVDDAYRLFLNDPHSAFRWCASVVGINRVANRDDLPENKFASRNATCDEAGNKLPAAAAVYNPNHSENIRPKEPHMAKVIQICFKREAAAAHLSTALCRLSARLAEAPPLAPLRLVSLSVNASYNYTSTPNIMFGYGTTTSSNTMMSSHPQQRQQQQQQYLLGRSSFGNTIVTEGSTLTTTSPSKTLQLSANPTGNDTVGTTVGGSAGIGSSAAAPSNQDAFQTPIHRAADHKILPNRRGSRAQYN